MVAVLGDNASYTEQEYYLLERVIDEGLDGAQAYLSETCDCSMLILESSGAQVYPPCEDAPRHLVVPFEATVLEDYYLSSDSTLYHSFATPQGKFYVVVENVNQVRYEEIVEKLGDLNLALTNYLMRVWKDPEYAQSFIYQDSIVKFDELLPLVRDYVDEQSDFICEVNHLISLDGTMSWKEICENEAQRLKRLRHSVCCVGFPEYLIFIIPFHGNDIDQDRYSMERALLEKSDAERWKLDYNATIIKQQGMPHRFMRINRSYREAMAAVQYFCLFEDPFLQKRQASELLVKLAVANPHTEKKTRDYLAPLLLPENESLFVTLIELVNSDFNWKTTGTKLCIHPNTVRYRAQQIEELLSVDFGDVESLGSLTLVIRLQQLFSALRPFEA